MKLKLIQQIILMSKYAFIGLFLQAFIIGMLLAKDGNAQKQSIENIYISLNLDNLELKEAFELIEENTEFNFAFHKNALSKKVRLKGDLKDESLANILRYISKDTGLKFRRIDNNIHVAKHRDIFKKDKVIVESLVQNKVTGKVTDAADNSPLPGVSILIKGTSLGTTTDLNGDFIIDVQDGETLQFSFIGYKSTEVVITNQSKLNISLETDLEQLEEVVVVGYGTQKEKDLTGAISSVKGEDLQVVVPASLDQGLQGLSAGVQVVNNSGAPGASPIVLIRGGNSLTAGNEPLYVIDGFPVSFEGNVGGALGPGGISQNPLASINPADVESVTVLKDASATAIYGARAANGVILITTKRGSVGKNRLTVDYSLGIDNVNNQVDMFGIRDMAEYYNEQAIISNNLYIADPSPLDIPFWSPSDIDTLEMMHGKEGFNYQDMIMRTGQTHNLNVSMAGGNEVTKYFVSTNYYDQLGIVKGSGFNRMTVRANLDSKLSERVNFGAQFNLSRNFFQASENSNINTNGSGPIWNALHMHPWSPPYVTEENLYLFEENGQKVGDIAGRHPTMGGSGRNPLENIEGVTNETEVYNVLSNMFLNATILKGLDLRVSVGADLRDSRAERFLSKITSLAVQQGGIAQLRDRRTINWLNENTLTYNKSFNKHNFQVLGGFTLQKNIFKGFGVENRNFVTEINGVNNIGSGSDIQTPNSSKSSWAVMSLLSRINYNYDSKYYANFVIRRDGSSRFGKDNKYATFTSGSLAWRVSDESFFDVDLINDLKIRSSFGQTGNQGISPYSSLTQLGNSTYVLGSNTAVVGFGPTQLGNSKLRWETTSQFNVGMDMSILNNRLGFTLDYYIKDTEDLLITRNAPSDLGDTRIPDNLGEIRNEGFEFSLTSVNIQNQNFNWRTIFNFTSNRNTVQEVGDDNLITSGSYHVIKEGEPLGSFWGRRSLGIATSREQIQQIEVTQNDLTPGSEMFEDINGDGLVNGSDVGVIGHVQPDFYFGLQNNLVYKRFSLLIQINGQWGGSVFNYNSFRFNTGAAGSNKFASAVNRFNSANPEGDQFSPGRGRAFFSDMWLEDASYLRIRNITLSYQIPVERLKLLEEANVFVATNNLLTFTKYTGNDPEASTSSGANAGVDGNVYPPLKTFRFGTRLTF